MKITQTQIPSGNDIAYVNGFLYLVSTENSGTLRIFRCEGDALTPLGSITELGNMRQIEISSDAVPERIIAAVTARECGLYPIA